MTNQLIALLDGREVGTIHYKNARLSFVYNDAWRADPKAYPLSLSMPLAEKAIDVYKRQVLHVRPTDTLNHENAVLAAEVAE